MVQLDIASVPPRLARPPRLAVVVLPLTVQLVSVVVPWLYRPPPSEVGEPPKMVKPVRVADTPLSTLNTRPALLPLIVAPAAGPVIVSVRWCRSARVGRRSG